MLENINSDHTALSKVETEEFGLGLDGVLSVEEEDYQVLMLYHLHLICLMSKLVNYQILC